MECIRVLWSNQIYDASWKKVAEVGMYDLQTCPPIAHWESVDLSDWYGKGKINDCSHQYILPHCVVLDLSLLWPVFMSHYILKCILNEDFFCWQICWKDFEQNEVLHMTHDDLLAASQLLCFTGMMYSFAGLIKSVLHCWTPPQALLRTNPHLTPGQPRASSHESWFLWPRSLVLMFAPPLVICQRGLDSAKKRTWCELRSCQKASCWHLDSHRWKRLVTVHMHTQGAKWSCKSAPVKDSRISTRAISISVFDSFTFFIQCFRFYSVNKWMHGGF